MATQDFIKQHRHDDVRRLAFLQDKYPEVDLPFALDQIRGWQTARRKLPAWAAREGLIYPPHLSMEQCSSEATAQLKADIVARLCPERRLLADLTGGFGVDFSYLARGFDKAVYVERQEKLCAIARHNLALLGLTQAEVVCTDSTEYLERMAPVDLIFVDPARRDSHGGRTFAIADCVPDVIALRPLLVRKARRLLLKLSPMLDWHKAVEDVGAVTDVFVVAVDGECKELLLMVQPGYAGGPRLHCVEWKTASQTSPKTASPAPPKEGSACRTEADSGIVDRGNYVDGGFHEVFCVHEGAIRYSENSRSSSTDSHSSSINSQSSCVNSQSSNTNNRSSNTNNQSSNSQSYIDSLCPSGTPLLGRGGGGCRCGSFLLLPSASIMKAGCFAELERAFELRQLAPNSHLFLSEKPVEGFPGRTFRLSAVSSFNKKELRQALACIDKANLAVRNFPMTVEELRRKLKLKDGGDHYIYATTDAEGHHLLLIGQKV